MSDRQEGRDDWVVPAVLVGLSLGLLLVIGIAFTVSAEDQADAPTLIEDLDVYTACLIDHGADVPRIEPGRDGGFTVTVPGSVLDGGVDEAALSQAVDACGDAAPDIFGPVFGGLSLKMLEGFDVHDEMVDVAATRFGLHEDGRRREGRGAGPWTPPPDELRRRCDRLDEVEIGADGLRGDRLRRLCKELDR